MLKGCSAAANIFFEYDLPSRYVRIHELLRDSPLCAFGAEWRGRARQEKAKFLLEPSDKLEPCGSRLNGHLTVTVGPVHATREQGGADVRGQ